MVNEVQKKIYQKWTDKNKDKRKYIVTKVQAKQGRTIIIDNKNKPFKLILIDLFLCMKNLKWGIFL